MLTDLWEARLLVRIAETVIEADHPPTADEIGDVLCCDIIDISDVWGRIEILIKLGVLRPIVHPTDMNLERYEYVD